MKRVLTILAILLLPLSVWAMTPVTDSDLSNVTGQAGVNINANVTMDISIGTMAWGDSDGVQSVYNPWTNVTNGGYIGVNNFNITNLYIKARTADTYEGYSTLMLKPITIDVATNGASDFQVTTTPSVGAAAITENMPANTTFVRFGLGALEIGLNALSFDVSLGARVGSGATAGTNAIVLGQNLGVASMGDMKMYINPWSYVDIYANTAVGNASGVNFAVNVTLDKFIMGYMSWGDKDGIVNTSSTNWMADNAAGYIGLNQFAINGPIALNGTVRIDINTTASGIYANLPVLIAALQHGMTIPAGVLTTLGITDAVVVPATPLNYADVKAFLATAVGHEITALVTATGIDEGGVLGATFGGATAAGYHHANSVVHISFPTDFIIDVQGSIVGAVALSNTNTLLSTAATTSTLGDIYIKGLVVDLKANSWVDIWAH